MWKIRRERSPPPPKTQPLTLDVEMGSLCIIVCIVVEAFVISVKPKSNQFSRESGKLETRNPLSLFEGNLKVLSDAAPLANDPPSHGSFPQARQDGENKRTNQWMNMGFSLLHLPTKGNMGNIVTIVPVSFRETLANIGKPHPKRRN